MSDWFRRAIRTVISSRGSREPHPGLLVPAFQATSLTGDTVTIGERTTDERQVLFFFTTTCAYCLTSIPALEELRSALARRPGTPSRLFAIGLDSASAVRRFAESRHLSFPVLLLPNQRLSLLYRVRAVPQLMVLDSSGHTVYARAGALQGAGVLDSIITAVTRRPQSIQRKQVVVAGSS
ncbi:TlpA disulfide reductase family protein [soil metagenome]